MTDHIPIKTLIDETLEIMHLLESTDDIGDCIIWNGYTGSTGHPMIRRSGTTKLVRREVFRMSGGNLVPRQPIDTRCGERCCINPEHLYANTIANIAKKAAKRGAWKGMARSMKIATKKREQMGKLTMEKAHEIRLSSESGPVLALRYGVDKSLINRVKAGIAWRDYANPFNQLMGLAA